MHTQKLPKKVKEYQNLMKNKENEENGRSECDLSALHTDVFTYTPQADGLLTYLAQVKEQ